MWSYNVETGERALKEVKEVLVRENDELLHIERSRGIVDATTSHPFYVVGKGWVAAGDLAVGDSIQAISGDAGYSGPHVKDQKGGKKSLGQGSRNKALFIHIAWGYPSR